VCAKKMDWLEQLKKHDQYPGVFPMHAGNVMGLTEKEIETVLRLSNEDLNKLEEEVLAGLMTQEQLTVFLETKITHRE